MTIHIDRNTLAIIQGSMRSHMTYLRRELAECERNGWMGEIADDIHAALAENEQALATLRAAEERTWDNECAPLL